MKIFKDNRLIAFLDILGFSSRLQNEDVDSLYKLFKGLIKEANTKVFASENVKKDGTVINNKNFFMSEFMSDSIVLVSNELDKSDNVAKFIYGCIHLMEIAFSMQFPLRGTIAIGDVLIDLENNIFLSKKFPSLVKCEALQEWSGCFLFDEETEDLVLKSIHGEGWTNPQTKQSSATIPYNIPVKTQHEIFNKPKRCLNWVHFLGTKSLSNGMSFLRGVKKHETQKFIKIVQSLVCDTSPLGEEHYPAVAMKTMASIAQLRTCFIDESGNPVNPGADVEITLQQPGDSKQYKMILYKHEKGKKPKFKSWTEQFLESK